MPEPVSVTAKCNTARDEPGGEVLVPLGLTRFTDRVTLPVVV
jgi:hypothetical protein